MTIGTIVTLVLILCGMSYGVYTLYVKDKLFERAHKDDIKNFTTKVMVRARPFRDNCLLSDPDSIKYDVYVFNDYKSYVKYLKWSKTNIIPKSYDKNDSPKIEQSTEYFNYFKDSSFDTLEHAKERAQHIIDKINEPNIYTESAKFNSKEIRDFNKKLNKLSDEDLDIA